MEGRHLRARRVFTDQADIAYSGAQTTAGDVDKLIGTIRASVIGDQEPFAGPFGPRRVTYADHTASGRSLSFIEDYLRDMVLPLYGNTHSSNSATSLQTTLFVHEAREMILKAVNGNTEKDVAIFCGSGSTGAINKMVQVLGLARPFGYSDATAAPRPVVFVSPYEHHSNMLPWRESIAEVVTIRATREGLLDLADLEQRLKEHAARPLLIGSFSAASNITGVRTDTRAVTTLLHRYGALSFWDYAAAAPHVKVDMNPGGLGGGNVAHMDAIFVSPHKFIGGPDTPGLLVAKKALFERSGGVHRSSAPGGGTVFFVSDSGHVYDKDIEHREEGGTLPIVGAVRAGLVFQLHEAVGGVEIQRREADFLARAVAAWSQNPAIVMLGPGPDVARLPIVPIMIRHAETGMFLHFNYVVALLNDLFGVQIRGGCACAGPYGQRLLGIEHLAPAYEEQLLALDENEIVRPGYARITLPFYFDEDTFNFVVRAVDFVATHGWKFLPQYLFTPMTGEWKHQRHIKTFNRRWLQGISYASGKMAYDRPVVVPEAADRSTYFTAALESLEETAKGFKLPLGDQSKMLSADAESLRWFLYPSEALDVLRGVVHPHRGAPFTPRAFPDTSEAGPTPQATFNPTDARPSTPPITPSAALASATFANASPAPSTADAGDAAPRGDGAPRAAQNGKKRDGKRAAKEAPASAPVAADAVSRTARDMREAAEKCERARIPVWTEGVHKLRPKVPKKLMHLVGKAIQDHGMIREGDRILVGISGGKDSLTLLHVLLTLQERSPVKFHVGCVTVDPLTLGFDPSPLIPYIKKLGVPYFYEDEDIIDKAKEMDAENPIRSICSFCSRMKRGKIYTCMRRENYNVLAFAQHLDDTAESLLMSAFFNGSLRTMKAHYTVDAGDLRMIRPLIYVREKMNKDFAYSNGLPVIPENCPGCFDAPQQRYRIKQVLAANEALFPQLFSNLLKAMEPLIGGENTRLAPGTSLRGEPAGARPPGTPKPKPARAPGGDEVDDEEFGACGGSAPAAGGARTDTAASAPDVDDE